MDDWASACRNVAGERCKGRSMKSRRECVNDDMKVLGLRPYRGVFRDIWRDVIWANA